MMINHVNNMFFPQALLKEKEKEKVIYW